MRAEYINPFIKSSISILSKTTGVLFNTGSPSVSNSTDSFKDVVVSLGVFGSLNGQALLCFEHNFAIAIANNMLNGMEDENNLGDLGKSALCELGNMIIGNSATLLFNSGMTVDITTPSIHGAEVFKGDPEMLSSINIPLECSFSAVNLKILIKEN